METILASSREKKFVNRGFLNGCFCPIYGLGSILIITMSSTISHHIKHPYISIFINMLLSIVLISLLEFLTGFILEKLFNCKWWDYSNRFANIKGYICLKYSLIWGLVSFMLLQIVHPIISNMIISIPYPAKAVFVLAMILYFTIDIIISILSALDLKNVLINYSSFTAAKYYEKILKYQRFFMACPRLMILNAGILNRDVRSILNGSFNKIKTEFKNIFQQ